jgi:hypothetical protein
MDYLGVALFVMGITDGPVFTINTSAPVAPNIVRVVAQLLGSLCKKNKNYLWRI